MADIRCPKCGKLNPPDRDVCRFCKSRLRPVNPPPGKEASKPGAKAPAAGQESPQPDWLSDLRQKDSGRGSGTAGLFLPDEGAENEASLDIGADLPEWMNSLGSERKAKKPAEPTGPDDVAAEEIAPGDQPEWLQRIRQRRETEIPEPAPASEPEPLDLNLEAGDEAPDWLAGLVDGMRRTAKPEPAPEWLKDQPSLPAGTPAAGQPEWSEEENLAANPPLPLPAWLKADEDARREPDLTDLPNLPEWLAEFSPPLLAAPPGKPAEPAAPAVPELQEEGPSLDWLADLSKAKTVTSEPEPIKEPTPEVTATTAPAFDWLANLTETEAKPAAAEEEVTSSADGLAATPESAFDWLASFSTPDEPVEIASEWGPRIVKPLEESEETDLFPAEVPDWLTRAMQDQSQAEAKTETETEAEITPAALPSWLEAMRPVVGVAASMQEPEDETQARVERAGPLAGLRGVLAAEPDITRVQKPPIYSVKLQVSETQQANADLLKRMVMAEGEPRPIPRRPGFVPQQFLRLGVVLVLLMAVMWPLFAGTQREPLPLLAPETERFGQVINDLPEQAHVLVAFDYEPSFSGEMDAVASAVMDHLMLRGAYLTIVSSSPSGPVIAERFLANTQAGHHYERGNQYINLGYIPGGPSGLLSFAEIPQRTVPYTLDGKPAWEQAGNPALPPLEGINHLADFGLVLVIVDNPDTARAWVEQVQPHLRQDDRQTPFMLVISAQAEPMVRPYYTSEPQQVQGMVVGLRGGAAYAHWIGRGELPRRYWDAFGLGLPVAAILITLGSLINSLAGNLKRSVRAKKPAPQPVKGGEKA